VTPPTPPVTPPTTIPSVKEIFFNFDKPAPGASGKAALDKSLTSKGKSNLAELVKQLRDDPTLKVQLVGRASPEGDVAYNLQLGERRAQMIAEALVSEGIDRSRIADPPESELKAECEEVGKGVHTCGKAGAKGDEDRQVMARVFKGK
jgi:hypothetical protein